MNKDKKTYKILVIEDNPGDVVLIEHYLSEQIANPAITQACSFKQVIQIMSAGNVLFDVILLDISLPDKSGQDLVSEMLRLASSCPIIILTGFADIDFSIKSISQGISDYLLKDDLNATTLYKSIIYAFERKKSTTLLRDSEKRFSDLFHLSPQPMWVFSQETLKFVLVNKAATTLYGYTMNEFLGLGLMDIKLDEDVLKAKERIKSRSQEDGVFKSTIMHRKKSGETMEMEIFSTAIIIDEKSLISVIAIDVTEKNLHEHNVIKAIIKTQEDERYEIGCELHDNVCQVLAASQLNLEILKESLLPPGLTFFNDCMKNIRLAFEEIRNLSHRLAPVFFKETPLVETFGLLLKDFNAGDRYNILLYFDSAVKKYQIDGDIQLNIYRILQEQLRNIDKYANATKIEVDLILHNSRIKMRISDNGVGFDVKTVKGGIGLANIKRRAELFSGRFEISSMPGEGCEIIIDIPVTTEKKIIAEICD